MASSDITPPTEERQPRSATGDSRRGHFSPVMVRRSIMQEFGAESPAICGAAHHRLMVIMITHPLGGCRRPAKWWSLSRSCRLNSRARTIAFGDVDLGVQAV